MQLIDYISFDSLLLKIIKRQETYLLGDLLYDLLLSRDLKNIQYTITTVMFQINKKSLLKLFNRNSEIKVNPYCA